jgi:hypothetical protein
LYRFVGDDEGAVDFGADDADIVVSAAGAEHEFYFDVLADFDVQTVEPDA